MTPVYQYVIESVVAHHQGRIADAQRQLSRELEMQQVRIRALSEAATEFLTTGIASMTRDNIYLKFSEPRQFGRVWFSWWAFFERIAKENQRPLITVTDYPDYITLTFPNRRYLDVVTAGFRLAYTSGCPYVKYWSDSKRESFNLLGSEGREMYRGWRLSCQYDLKFRRALRLS